MSEIPNDLLSRGVADVIVRRDLDALLKSGKKLRIKHGVDPTKPDLHLGYAVVYRKLREFQDLGHTIIFLIGDFTGRFGDPTDKIKSRALRSKDEVEKVAQTYLDQVGKILDKKKLEIRRNSEWYDKMSAEDLLRLMSQFTVSRVLERDMFVKRRKLNEEIGLHEPVYPVLQAYDSVMLKSDLTIIGTDQTFNELQARPLQEFFGQKPQQVMSMKLLVGTDGKNKMSQSLGNYVRFLDTPEEMFGKLMSIPDEVMPSYAELLSNLDMNVFFEPKDPRAAKASLAKAIVTEFHGEDAAVKAAEEFENVHTNKEAPSVVHKVTLHDTVRLSDAVSVMFKVSKTEAKTLITQGSISVDQTLQTDPFKPAKSGIYRKGKRHFKELVLKKKK